MKNSIYFLILFISSLIFSCGSKRDESLDTENMRVIPEQTSTNSDGWSNNSGSGSGGGFEKIDKEEYSKNDPNSTLTNKSVNKKKIIKNGTIAIKASNIVASKKRIDLILKNLNSYYDKEDFDNSPQRISYNLKVRIPTENFEKLILEIEKGDDEITNKSIQATDVTEEFVDIETRLVNKKAYLQKYKDLLAKATTIKDILAIEENIAALQEEIESREGRLKYLSDQVSYSTLEINLFKDVEFVYKPQHEDNFFERLKKSLSNGWSSIVDFVLFLFKIWPFVILISIITYFIRRRIKRNKAK